LEDSSPQKGKNGKKIIIIFSGVLILLGSGAWGLLFSPWHVIDGRSLLGLQSEKAESAKAKPEVRPYIYKMDPIVVNLKNTEKMRYLKIKMEIESSEYKVNEEYEKRLPQLRDTILGILTNKNSTEILDSEGKERLRGELKEKMNQFLSTFQIQTIYFAEFVIQ
jgi:flagellar FliL protein